MAAASFSRLDPFDCKNGDFEYYLEQFDQFLAINSVADDESKKVPLFIASIGQDAYKILKELCGQVDPKEKSFEELRDLLLQYFAQREFYGRNQRQGEYTGAFINEVKRLSLKCNFGPFQKEALRDRIACGRLPEDGDDTKVQQSANPRSKSKQRQKQQQNQPKNPQLVEELQAMAIPDPTQPKGARKKQSQQNQQKQRVGQQQQQGQGQEPQSPVEVHVHVQQNSAMRNRMPVQRQRQRKCRNCGDRHHESECPEEKSGCGTQ